jgi:acetyl-CoA decarbonylase/synthase complex subunit delta
MIARLGTIPTARTVAEEAADTVAAAVALSMPLVVYDRRARDADVLKKVAERVTDTVLAIGAATDENYKPITAAALGYGHVVVAETPIDVNMAKQLNILITQIGLAPERVLIDPSVGAVGYGVEYAFTVMQRLRIAALNQNDDMCQMPLICNLGREAWRSKEARATQEEEPAWGDAEKRGVMWEVATAIASPAWTCRDAAPRCRRDGRKAIDGLLDQ